MMRIETLHGVLPLLVGFLLAACGGRQEPLYFPLPEQSLEVVQSEKQAFMVDTLLSDLNRPWSLEFLPDNRVLITERAGSIQVVRDGVLQEPLKGEIPTGLRDIKLHPEFEKNGLIYFTRYIEPGESNGGYTTLMRGRLEGDRMTGIEELYRAGPFRIGGEWTGSRIAFDGTGHIYFMVGIRGNRMNAQDLMHHSGKIMRLTEDGSIPEDNPFAGDPEALPEIWTLGHREHQGLMIHPVNGQVWATEHGEMGGDELNVIEKGNNYGWPLATHSLEYNGEIISEDPFLEGTTPPIHYWTPSIGPGGLTLVTGGRYPGWEGDLFVGSLAQRRLNRTEFEGERIAGDEALLPHIGRVRSVVLAPDRYLYFITEDTGLLIRLLPAE